MKKIFILLTMTVTIFLFTACGTKTENVEMSMLEKQMVEADSELPSMLSVSSETDDAENLFSYLSNMEYKKVDQFFLQYAEEGTAEEIAVIRVKDSSDIEEAKKSLEEHNKERINFYKSYDPTQVERAQSAQIFTKGNYAVLIVSNKGEAVKNAFDSLVK